MAADAVNVRLLGATARSAAALCAFAGRHAESAIIENRQIRAIADRAPTT